MSYYLERNASLIAEINDEVRHGFMFDRVAAGRSPISGTNFYRSGKFDSRVLGQILYLGLKEYRERDPDEVAFSDLGVYQRIADEIPELLPEIPLVHGLLTILPESPRAILTEDASEGGRLTVWPVHVESAKRNGMFPEELRRINPYLEDDDLVNAVFEARDNPKIIGRRRILDVDKLHHGLPPGERWEVFPMKHILQRSSENTVFTAQKF